MKWQQLRTLEAREGDENSTKLSGMSSDARTRAVKSARGGQCEWPHTAGTRKQMNSAKKAAGTKVGQLPAQNKAVGDSMWGCSCGGETSLCQDVWKLFNSYVSKFNSIRVVELGCTPFQRVGFVRPTNLISGYPYKRAIGIAIVAAPRPAVTDPDTLNMFWKVFIAWYTVQINGRSRLLSHLIKDFLKLWYYTLPLGNQPIKFNKYLVTSSQACSLLIWK